MRATGVMSKAVASWKRGMEARMTRMSLVLCWLCLAAPMGASDDGYAPLWLYQGKWQLKTNGQEKADTIANECKRVGKYFACEQAVNGKVESLIVFVPAETPSITTRKACYPTSEPRAGPRSKSRATIGRIRARSKKTAKPLTTGPRTSFPERTTFTSSNRSPRTARIGT